MKGGGKGGREKTKTVEMRMNEKNRGKRKKEMKKSCRKCLNFLFIQLFMIESFFFPFFWGGGGFFSIVFDCFRLFSIVFRFFEHARKLTSQVFLKRKKDVISKIQFFCFFSLVKFVRFLSFKLFLRVKKRRKEREKKSSELRSEH